jgi:hypothetical protein
MKFPENPNIWKFFIGSLPYIVITAFFVIPNLPRSDQNALTVSSLVIFFLSLIAAALIKPARGLISLSLIVVGSLSFYFSDSANGLLNVLMAHGGLISCALTGLLMGYSILADLALHPIASATLRGITFLFVLIILLVGSILFGWPILYLLESRT